MTDRHISLISCRLKCYSPANDTRSRKGSALTRVKPTRETNVPGSVGAETGGVQPGDGHALGVAHHGAWGPLRLTGLLVPGAARGVAAATAATRAASHPRNAAGWRSALGERPARLAMTGV